MLAKDILKRASILAQDKGFVRWTPPELLLYLNDGAREIANYKPNAVTKTVEIALAAGTLQALPPEYISLIRVERNLGAAEGRPSGTAITVVSRSSLDLVIPGWADAGVLPAQSSVQHVIQDMQDPRSFHVVPGNDGTGIIQAVVSVLPVDIAEPANLLDVEAYGDQVAIPDIFQNSLVDYVLYRAYSKDSTDGNSLARASAHYNQFANAIGMKIQADQTANVNTTGQT
jgi:hypothetical protein